MYSNVNYIYFTMKNKLEKINKIYVDVYEDHHAIVKLAIMLTEKIYA